MMYKNNLNLLMQLLNPMINIVSNEEEFIINEIVNQIPGYDKSEYMLYAVEKSSFNLFIYQRLNKYENFEDDDTFNYGHNSAAIIKNLIGIAHEMCALKIKFLKYDEEQRSNKAIALNNQIINFSKYLLIALFIFYEYDLEEYYKLASNIFCKLKCISENYDSNTLKNIRNKKLNITIEKIKHNLDVEFYRISFDLIREIFANKSKNHKTGVNCLDDNKLLESITVRALENHFNFTKNCYQKHKIEKASRSTPYRKTCYDLKIFVADNLETLKIKKNELYFNELMTRICFKNSSTNKNQILNLLNNEDRIINELYLDISKINATLKIQKNQLTKIKKLILSKRKYMNLFSLEPNYEFYKNYEDYAQNLNNKCWQSCVADKVDVIKSEIEQLDIFFSPKKAILQN